jgi:hypothetical protein
MTDNLSCAVADLEELVAMFIGVGIDPMYVPHHSIILLLQKPNTKSTQLQP